MYRWENPKIRILICVLIENVLSVDNDHFTAAIMVRWIWCFIDNINVWNYWFLNLYNSIEVESYLVFVNILLQGDHSVVMTINIFVIESVLQVFLYLFELMLCIIRTLSYAALVRRSSSSAHLIFFSTHKPARINA